ncbi:MAG: DNA-formamidopyrimidine glycosylase family protein, partial [Chloroflexota bacterium]
MPELPEVETVVQGLQSPLIGRTFTGVTVLWDNTVQTSIPELEKQLPGQCIDAITRRAKYLQFHLSAGDTLFIHLKMSGDLLVEPTTEPV